MRPFTIWLFLSFLVVSCSKVDNTDRDPVPGPEFRAKLARLNWGTDTTFVYGHKTPDVDAITSSLSYAKLMRALGQNHRTAEVVLGKLPGCPIEIVAVSITIRNALSVFLHQVHRKYI